jgi:F-type H+-transporting ATPase subunit b
MPQIAQLSEVFASQLFWLVVTFGLIYLVIGRGMVPKIEATVEARDRRISDDLVAADAAREAADETEAGYRARIDEARAEALKVTQAAKAASARETEDRVRAADAEINEKTDAAEARIRAAAEAAMADVEMVAAEAAQDLVARLSGGTVPEDRARSAVKEALVHG